MLAPLHLPSAATSTDGTKVVLTYDEALSATTAAASAFTVTTAGSANAVTAVAISGSTVELTLTNAVQNDQAVTVAYADPSGSNDTNAVQDSQGNDAASLSSTSVTNNSTVAGTRPTFSSAATSTDGTKVVLTYDEALSATTAAASAFTVTTAGSANAVTAVAISGSTVELTLTNTVQNDQAVTVAYADPSGSNDTNAVQDSQGNDAASLQHLGHQQLHRCWHRSHLLLSCHQHRRHQSCPHLRRGPLRHNSCRFCLHSHIRRGRQCRHGRCCL